MQLHGTHFVAKICTKSSFKPLNLAAVDLLAILALGVVHAGLVHPQLRVCSDRDLIVRGSPSQVMRLQGRLLSLSIGFKLSGTFHIDVSPK